MMRTMELGYAQTSAAVLLPLAWVLGGIVAGLAVYALLLQPARKLGERQGWSAVTAGASVLASVVVLWGALAGLYLALDTITLSPHSAGFLDRAIGALAILSVTWVAARIAGAAVESYGRRMEHHRLFSVSIFSSIVQGAILVVGILTVLSSLGVAIAPLLTTLGLGGLAVALALRDTLANLFSGIHIVASRQIRPGDFVKFDIGVEGEVTDIKWRNTVVRDAQNNTIVVPNEKIANAVFTNYSLCVSDLFMAVPATLPWKGSYEMLEDFAIRAARESIQETAGLVLADRCSVALTFIGETNLQITAYLPVGYAENRTAAAGKYLRRLYDAARAANMGAPAAPQA